MTITYANIPQRLVGPMLVKAQDWQDSLRIPLATFEQPLWPSVNRGARISRAVGGITVTCLKANMTRSVVLEAQSASAAVAIEQSLRQRIVELQEVVAQTSRYTSLEDWHTEIVGGLLFLRFSFRVGDASGHNMVTKAADTLMSWLQQQYELCYVSISANLCTDKKVSAINGILGRGHYMIAEATIPRQICQDILGTTPEALVGLHIKKNLIGTTLAGGLRTANAHYANMLLAFYLSTGQDAANIVEGSQGITHMSVTEQALSFSVTLPNIILGAIGNGKDLPFVQENLSHLGCLEKNMPIGYNARRLASLAAATVWCGEISLLAAQTKPGELMRSHLAMERATTKKGDHCA